MRRRTRPSRPLASSFRATRIPTTAASPTARRSRARSRRPTRATRVRRKRYPCPPTRKPTARAACAMANHTIRTEAELGGLRREFSDIYGGRTVLVTGADGFMGSHLTEALVAPRRDRPPSCAPPRAARSTTSGTCATSSRCTSPTSRTRRPSTTSSASCATRRQAVRLPPRRPGARRRVVAPPVRDGDGEHDRHAEPAAIGARRGLELEKFDTAGTSRSTATCATTSPTTTRSTTRAR